MKEIARIFDLLELYSSKYDRNKTVFSHKPFREWISYTSGDYVNYANLVSLGFLAMGLRKGERVATIMANRPEWNFFDMGLLQAGAIQVPIYPTISEESFRFIFNDAAVRYIIVSDREIYRRIQRILPFVASLEGVFSIEKVARVPHWEEILEAGRHNPDVAALETVKASVLPGDLATIIYTSGTTGKPKGVMLSHRNFVSNFLAVTDILGNISLEKALSFLPLCHVYERMLNYMYQYTGTSVYYIDRLEELGELLREVKPDIFCAVPRVLEKTYANILRRGKNLPFLRRMIFFWALEKGHKFELNGANGWWYEIQLKIANSLVFKKWRKALGDRLKIIVSGGASLHPKLARVFWAARIKVMEGYGLTETSPVVAVGTFEHDGVRFGCVGPVLPGVEVKIAADGEILCRGPNVMLGYLNRPDRTTEAIDPDGWFHTGDIGELEDEKYLKITDRKKEIFKTSGGKYIAPQVIENRFKESSFIENIMVIGENRKFPAALIVPNFEFLKSWCNIKRIPYASEPEVLRKYQVIRRFQKEVNRFNAFFDKTEQIKKFELLEKEWTVLTGELSPTMKLRRKFIAEKYAGIIAMIYES